MNDMVQLYKRGMSCRRIGEKFGLSEKKVYSILKKRGVKFRARGAPSKLTDRAKRTIVSLRKSGHSLREIVVWLRRKHDVVVSHQTIMNWLDPRPWGKPSVRGKTSGSSLRSEKRTTPG